MSLPAFPCPQNIKSRLPRENQLIAAHWIRNWLYINSYFGRNVLANGSFWIQCIWHCLQTCKPVYRRGKVKELQLKTAAEIKNTRENFAWKQWHLVKLVADIWHGITYSNLTNNPTLSGLLETHPTAFDDTCFTRILNQEVSLKRNYKKVLLVGFVHEKDTDCHKCFHTACG